MKDLMNKNELPDLQKIKLEKILDEDGINAFFKTDFYEINGEILRGKFMEFFETTNGDNFAKRLYGTYDLLIKWLGGNDQKRTNEAISFCNPIIRIIAKYSLEARSRKNKSAELIKFDGNFKKNNDN